MKWLSKGILRIEFAINYISSTLYPSLCSTMQITINDYLMTINKCALP